MTGPGSSELMCFICDGPETEREKLINITKRGLPQILTNSEQVGDAKLIRRLQSTTEAWNNGEDSKLRYHKDCKTKLYNRVKSISTATANRKLLVFLHLYIKK